jgi:hypothetical protein
MAMTWQNAALFAAGIVGSAVAVFHGVVTQRLMVRPIEALFRADGRTSGTIRRLVPLLLHFSTVVWFVGGLALIAAASVFGPDARLVTSLFVGSAYLFGVLGNLWGTRGRHPGWMLLGIAVILIALGV